MYIRAVLMAIVLFAIPTVYADPLPVLVVCGLKDEANLIKSNNVIVLVSASNPQQLRTLLKDYDATKVRAVISFGVAGALDPNMQVGQLVVANQVKTVDPAPQQWNVTPELSSYLNSQLQAAGLNVMNDVMATTETLSAVNPTLRAELRAATGADSVDMESQVGAAFAQANGLPFAVIRAISDPADFTVPPAATLPLKPDGTPDQSAVDASIQADPSQLGDLMKFNTYYQNSLAALKKALKAVDLGQLPFGSVAVNR